MTILQEIIKIIKNEFKKLPDSRGVDGIKYTMDDIAMSAYAVFYFQNGSWLNFQRNMTNTTGRSNAKSLFGIEAI
ncbi:MAG: ISNCY family transposase, partial [Campylobacterota bacterium]|nr:ISNCY family transposase [Campylobacterota bacterium]